MLNVKPWGQRSRLAASLLVGSTELSLPVADLALFTVPPGSWYYLTITQGNRREVVQVVGRFDNTFQVVRGQDQTTEQNWLAGMCVEVVWNVQQLREFIQQVGAGAEPSGVAPGTYCLDCTSCMDVNAAGQITRISGSEGCV